MTAGEPVQWAGGVVRVRLPPGQVLEQRGGRPLVAGPRRRCVHDRQWLPDDGGADELLAAERASAEDVEVEYDEETMRGGIPVRRTALPTRRHTPRVVLDDAAHDCSPSATNRNTARATSGTRTCRQGRRATTE